MKTVPLKRLFVTAILVIVVGIISCGKAPTQVQEDTTTNTNTRVVLPPSFETPTKIATLTPKETPTKTNMPLVLLPVNQVQPHPLALDTDNINSMIRLSRFGTGSPNYVAFSPDGKYLAVATGLGVFFYDATTFEQLRFMDVNTDVIMLAFSSNGNTLLIATYLRGNTAFSLWDVETGRKIIEMEKGFNSFITKIAYSNRGYVAVTGHESECGVTCQTDYFSPITRVWSAATGRIIFEGTGQISGFSADGNTLYFPKYFPREANKSLNLATYEIQEVSEDQITAGTEAIPGSANIDNNYDVFAISKDGRFKALWKRWGTEIEIIDLQTNQKVSTLQFDATYSLVVEKTILNGIQRYVAATWNGSNQLNLWDLFTGEKIAVSERVNTDHVGALAFSPDQHTLASVVSDGSIWLWNIDTMQPVYKYETHTTIYDIQFSTDGTKIKYSSEDGAYELNLQNEVLVSYPYTSKSASKGGIGIIDSPSGDIYNISFPPNTGITSDSAYNNISFGSDVNTFFLNDVSTGATTELPLVPDYKTNWFLDTFAISSDENYLAGGFADSPIAIWDLHTRQRVAWLTGHQSKQTQVDRFSFGKIKFSPWTNLLLSVGSDETTRLWNIQTGEQLVVLNVCCAEFSPDGRIIVTGGDGVIRVWGIPPWP